MSKIEDDEPDFNVLFLKIDQHSICVYLCLSVVPRI